MVRFTLFAMIAAIGLLTFSQANAMDGTSLGFTKEEFKADFETDFNVAQARAERELTDAKKDYQAAIQSRLANQWISSDEVAESLIATAEDKNSFESESLTKLEVSKPWILASAGESALDVFQGEGPSALQARKFLPAQGD